MHLSPKQIEIIGECLHAATHGPFFPDGVFSTLFGLSREEVAAVSEEWPVVIKSHAISNTAINSSINNLLGYPTKSKAEIWDDYISVDRSELIEVYAKWREQRVEDSPRGHFDRLM